MGKELFRINDIDFTGYIMMPSYTINSQPVYEEWKDGNGINHREIVRRQVTGTFDMFFNDRNEYYRFLDYLKDSEEIEGYSKVSVYVNNLHEVYDIDAYIKVEPANTEPYMGTKPHDGFTVSVEER